MIILISAIILLGIVTYYFHRRDLKKQVEKTNKIVQTEIQEPPQECCGRHLVCERDSLLAGVSKTIEYYDDERNRTRQLYTRTNRTLSGNFLYATTGRCAEVGTQFAITANRRPRVTARRNTARCQ